MRPTIYLLVLAACTEPTSGGTDAPTHDLADEFPTSGRANRATFSLDLGPATRTVAEGARVLMEGATRSDVPLVASVTAEPPIFAFPDRPPTVDGGPVFALPLTAIGAGDADLVLRDATGAEIDRLPVHASASDTLQLERPWGSGDALVLAGEVERMHVTTMAQGVVTLGTGAVEFTHSDTLISATSDDTPWFFSEGDQTFVKITGAGSITARAPDATATVAIKAVAPADLTAITRSEGAFEFRAFEDGHVAIGATVAGVPVYGPRCTWSASIGLQITLGSFVGDSPQHGWIGSDPTFVYTLHGNPGTYTATCTLPGGLATTLSVVIDP